MTTETQESLSHAERLKKNIEDVKFVLILLGLLLVITVAWNVWNSHKLQSQQNLCHDYQRVYTEMQEMVDAEFIRKAQRIRENISKGKNTQQIVKDQFGPVTDDIWPKVRPPKGTGEEVVTVPEIAAIRFDELVRAIYSIKVRSLDVWCTAIDDLEPILTEEGFVRQDGGQDVYKVKRMKFSRFVNEEE